jgi:CO/xanthine dehydrogenase Mo-binding subunit
VHDCGLILNPIGAQGQVEGGVVMGIGEALLEGTVLTDDGRQRNPGLLDYKLQTCSDAPPITIEFVTSPDISGGGPKGSKGVGEPPCVPTPGAVANAIAKVIGAPVTQLPMSPDRVWSAAGGARA